MFTLRIILIFFIYSCFFRTVVMQIVDQILEEDVTDLNSVFCQQKWSCKETEIDDRNCKCDSECTVYNDCCSDVASNQTIQTFVQNFSCEYIPGIDEDSYVFVVQKCPPGTSTELKKECESFGNDQIPVSGKATGYMYRNMYCAACHGEEFLSWQTGFSCNWSHRGDVNRTLESMQNDEHCSKRLYPPTSGADSRYKSRRCFPITDTCLSTHSASRCQDGPTEVVFNDHVYKNKDCALCNNVSIDQLVCSARAWTLRPSGEKRKITSYSYRLLFDYHTNLATGTYVQRRRAQKPERNSKICPTFELYDLFTDACRKVNCIIPLVYENGKCVYKPTVLSKDKPDTFSRGKVRSDCVYIQLNDTEYEIINNYNIFIYTINKTLTNDSFYEDSNHAYVCRDLLNELFSDDYLVRVYREAESILSLVGSVLSITALTITLFLYLRFPKLQNTPGKSLICLMVSLIVAQLLFLLANTVEDHRHVCIGFAITIHYAFLTSVFWMNCMSFDIFITFSKGFVKTEEDESNKKFVCYSVYAWVTPMLIVVSGVCLDAFTVSDFSPLYGQVVCWIGNKQALLVYFLVPIGLLVLTNMFFYIFTVRSIFVSSRKTNKILRRKEGCKLLVYVKLSIVMGLTWVFAYIASFSNETVFWYLFICFGSWQGVFIFISFVCFGKVRSHVIDRARVVSSYLRSRTITTVLTDSTKT